MIWIPFYVECGSCGHKNLPARSPQAGIEMVLTGRFSTCRHCKTQFSRILVPSRPLVESVRSGLTDLSPLVEIESGGRISRAIGCVEDAGTCRE